MDTHITVSDGVFYLLSKHPTASFWLIYLSILLVCVGSILALLMQSLAMLWRVLLDRHKHLVELERERQEKGS